VLAVYEIPLVGLEIDQSMVTILGALALVVLVGLSAFFSSSEIALFSIPKHRVEGMAEDGIPGAARVKAKALRRTPIGCS